MLRTGVLVRQLLPDVEAVETGRFTRTAVIQHAAAMHSGLLLNSVLRLDLYRLPFAATWRVAQETCSYSVINRGHGVVIRHDAGHHDHSFGPHVHCDWPHKEGIAIPVLDPETGLSITKFVQAVERWRVQHAMHLSKHDATLKNIRFASAMTTQ